MNRIKQLEVEYLVSSRTIETLEITAGNESKICFIYNYEGIYFRVFESMVSIIQFFEFQKEPDKAFCDENKLDKYLTVNLKI